MKKIVLLMFVVCAALTANAQIYAGGSLGFWNNDDADVTTFKFVPEVGYNLSETWALGVELGYEKDAQKASTVFVAPYARYSYFKSGAVSLFLDGGFGFASIKPDGGDSASGFEIGIKPGIAISLTDKFSLVSKIGFLGYKDDYYGNGFGLDLDASAISFGFFVNF